MSHPHHHKTFLPSRLALAVALCGSLCAPALAATLEPGESAIVQPGDPTQAWFLRSQAELTLMPGATSHQIHGVSNSRVTLDGAEVEAQGRNEALSLLNSQADIRDSWLASDTVGLRLASSTLVAGDASSAVVDNSIIVAGKTAAELESASLHAFDSIFWSEDDFGYGITMADGQLHLGRGSEVSGATGILLQSAYLFTESQGNHLVIDGGSSVEGRDGSAIVVKAGNVGLPTEASIVVSNGSTLKASNGVLVDVERGAQVDMTIANSHLTGQLRGLTALSLVDQASWTLTQDAEVGSLALERSTVDLGGSAGDFRQLTLDSLSGSGQFNMGVDLAALQGDLLKVNGTANGDFRLKIANTGREPEAGASGLTVVQTGGGTGHFDVVGGQVDAGAFAYVLQREGDDWALVQKVDRQGRRALSASSQSVLGLYNAAPVVWSGELTGLRSRFDELRRTPAATGLWLRAQGAKYEVGHTDLRTYDMRQSGFTLGSDLALSQELTVGLLAGSSKADLDFSRGTRGSIDSVFVGAYAGWTEATGLYVDALVKANRFSNRADVLMSDGVKARGKYNDFGLGGSLELGKRLTLGEGWYLKPYAQLTALSVQGQGYRLDNGLTADSNAARSLSGRLGSQFGRTLAMAGGGTLQPYLKLAAAREFADGNQARINGQTFDNSLKGNSIELGTGFTAQLSEAWQMNAEFDYATGHRVDQPYGVSAGLRYAF
ncbi:autotransporter outer membrane beta-barrel domain-containing protein [Pseudomonas sp. HR96]|uniref:autotransporter outer membrane beta-barrel domain-containing protein n=1 Tax=Pseudomonas sp. HR96 TaxID=1027966 RepID=UPI002A761F0D|nr:autotransporter outer membrane beta-barrel domain-containing protein [Pseudomonas sp. HR96]WPP00513.1 autotransporter outer membrane beta-barrel domain-containing protein [Pseudomonas sp. HR96]